MTGHLLRKLLRDVLRFWSQFVAVFLMAMLSVLIYTGLEGAWNGLDTQLDRYAAETRLADVWVALDGQEDVVAERVSALTGVHGVEAAEFFSTSVAVEDGLATLEVEVLSDDRRRLSRPTVVEGPTPTPDARGIWIAQPFAEAHGLRVGDLLEVGLGGGRSLPVEGVYFSSEKLYHTGTASLVAPAPGRFSYAILPAAELAAAEPPARTSTVLRVNADVTDALQADIVAAAGDALVRITDRETNDAVSTAYDRVDQIRNLSTLFSFVFVLLAVLAMYTSTRRLVEMQSREVATLKSLGYSGRTIGTHFSLYGLVAGGAGGVVGLLAAPAISTYVLSTQQAMLSMPAWSIGYTLIPVGVLLVVVLVCVAGAYLAARPALRGVPADQLRPGVARGRRVFVERFERVWERTRPGSRWAWRDSGANPARLLMGVTGVAGSLMLLFAGFGMADSMNGQVRSAFVEENSYAARLALAPTAPLNELARLAPSSQLVQELVVRTWPSDGFDRVVTVLDAGDFVHVRTVDGQPVDLDHVTVTHATAERIGVTVGDTVEVALPAGGGLLDLRIGQIIEGSAPQGFTMSRTTWESLGRDFAPTTMLVGDEAALDELGAHEAVLSALTLDEQRANASAMVDDLGGIFMLIRVFAILLAVIVLYSLGSLAFTERVRDYATLKVLGFTTRDLRSLAARENLIATALGVIAGIPAGFWFLSLYVGTFSTPRLEYTAQITAASIGIATLIAVLFSSLTTVLLGRRIRRVDMVGALKGIE
ncbi:FtsX-like permease family protein [Cellulomonas sp. Y8]|uniref:ABC transporter permease n=1 Tax=Cellulomonas sp. Y8 TaxID=2591145 RepID=UPI003D7470CA